MICKPPDFKTFRRLPFSVQSVDFLLKHRWPSLQSSKAICNGRALHNVYASGFGENEKVQRNGRREKKNADIQNLTKKNGLVCFYARPSFARLSKKYLIRNLNTWLKYEFSCNQNIEETLFYIE